jgi:outer membrane protein assembly factor BamB
MKNNHLIILPILFTFLIITNSSYYSDYSNSPQQSFSGVIGTQYWAYSSSLGNNIINNPIIGDFDLDGNMEIVFFEYPNQLLKCIYGNNGTVKWSVPQNMVINNIIASNIDEEPTLELVLTGGDAYIYVFSGVNGSLKCKIPAFSSSPLTIGDVDGDTIPEIIVTSGMNGSLLCYDGKGNLKYSAVPPEPFSGNLQMALIDADNDNQTEIIAVNPSANKILSFRGSTGIAKWSSTAFSAAICTIPIPVDLDHDGFIEIIFGTTNGFLNAVRGINGTTLWTKNISYNLITDTQISYILMGDINQDKNLEILLATSSNILLCLNSTGDILWQFNATNSIKNVGMLADIDDDRIFEILIIANSSVICLNALTGGMEWNYQTQNSNPGFVEAADVDGDGKMEIITTTYGSTSLYCLIGSGKPWLQPSPLPCFGGSQYHTGDYQDTDRDGIPDALERWINTNPHSQDSDGDGVTDNEEIRLRINPLSRDSDGDSMPDGWELSFNFDPLNAVDGLEDPDNDDVINMMEYSNQTNPHNNDTDGDLLPDGWEIKYQLDPLNASDAQSDPDKDISNNLKEFRRNTNPQNPDTDGDKIPDGIDPFPLNFWLDYVILAGGLSGIIGINIIRFKFKHPKLKMDKKMQPKSKRK